MYVYPVILCGGNGERLWPISKNNHPKPFIKINNDETLLNNTIKRYNSGNNHTLILSNQNLKSNILSQMIEKNVNNFEIIYEPSQKNTAPCIYAAAMHIAKKNPEGLMLIMPSDHLITDENEFNDAVNTAAKFIDKYDAISFGCSPKSAHTGYGYIKYKENSEFIKNVAKFIEKPNQNTADIFIKDGNYLWNLGIFLFKATKLIELANSLDKENYSYVAQCYEQAEVKNSEIYLNSNNWNKINSISIDYSIMEKNINSGVVIYNYDWSDLGTFDSIKSLLEKDELNNAKIGETTLLNCSNSFVWVNDDTKIIAAIGLRNITAIASENEILIADNTELANIKTLVSLLGSSRKLKHDKSSKTITPWGWFMTLNMNENFHIKLLHVRPDSSLSLQSHVYRNEHWYVLKGIATIQHELETYELYENQSTYIKQGQRHRISNLDSNNYLQIIEIQTGTSFAEDDITRYEDIYDRV